MSPFNQPKGMVAYGDIGIEIKKKEIKDAVLGYEGN